MGGGFFERQDEAHKKSRQLIHLMALSVAGVVVLVHVGIVALIWWSSDPGDWIREFGFTGLLFKRELFLSVAIPVVVVVAGGSLWKLRRLRGGGADIAARLGGIRIDPATADGGQRRALNVVEEMAIASGVPVPPVFVLQGQLGINAFAAGYNPSDAAIGITEGAISGLSRDELQGVIAHEFSHILNGDMRLNVRLIGIVHGILLLGLIGQALMNSERRRFGRRREGGKNLAALGFVLWVVGLVGTLFGNMIKAAISREREYLADASAVQFTRNPDGLAGALRKVGGLVQGSIIHHEDAAELSHMYFGAGVVNRFGRSLATHPSLTDRIRQLDPTFDGEFPEVTLPSPGESPWADEVAAVSHAVAGACTDPAKAAHGGNLELEDFMGHIGEPEAAHLAYARGLLAALPDELKQAAHDPQGAWAVLGALLLDSDPDVRESQRRILDARLPQGAKSQLAQLEDAAERLDLRARGPLLELAVGTLRGIDARDLRALRDIVAQLVAADGRIDAFEWVVGSLVVRHLDPTRRKRRRSTYTNLKGTRDSVVVLLSVLAREGAQETKEVDAAFRAGISVLPELGSPSRLPDLGEDIGALDEALDKLSRLAPSLKERVLEACTACIAWDGLVEPVERELFRAVAEWLDCPVPPLDLTLPVSAEAAAPVSDPPVPEEQTSSSQIARLFATLDASDG